MPAVADDDSLAAAAEAFAAPQVYPPERDTPVPPSSPDRAQLDVAAGVYRFTADSGPVSPRRKKRPPTR